MLSIKISNLFNIKYNDVITIATLNGTPPKNESISLKVNFVGTIHEKLCLHHILETLSDVNVHAFETNITLHITTSKHDAAKFKKKYIQYFNLGFIGKNRINNILSKPNFTFSYIYYAF